MENPRGFTATFTHIGTIARISSQKWSRQHRYYVLKMSVNNFWPCIIENASAVRWHSAIVEQLAAFLGENGYDNIVAMS